MKQLSEPYETMEHLRSSAGTRMDGKAYKLQLHGASRLLLQLDRRSELSGTLPRIELVSIKCCTQRPWPLLYTEVWSRGIYVYCAGTAHILFSLNEAGGDALRTWKGKGQWQDLVVPGDDGGLHVAISFPHSDSG